MNCAINNAVKILCETSLVGHVEPSDIGKKLYLLASDILRVSDHLEAGHLASNGKETAKETAPAPQPAPAATNKGDDEHVPF